VAVLAQQMGRLASAAGNEAYGSAKGELRRARKRLNGAAAEAGEAVQEASENAAVVLEDAVANRPLAALAIAAGVGFVMGAAWRR
jgi:ElaB/YqjD/DUF883 family membrane-anchored ribosome-binding protein